MKSLVKFLGILKYMILSSASIVTERAGLGSP
ncbi:hypothetical protein T11_2345 [Trichinella zimbabwensis]|uniref:Uncharacterized protein n=1 Tax=Trichinella zimbabwensis TaxID=268475 RepID=A0A0V1F3F6_9BILA|nr:hypothetical protein T11_2345 [Trichinella zimbabwensis]